MSIIAVVAEEVEAAGVDVGNVEVFVLALTLGYMLGRRVSESPDLPHDDEKVRELVRQFIECGAVGARPPLSERAAS